MQTFGLKDEHIKLGQLLKATGLVGSGVDAKKIGRASCRERV